MDINPFEIAGKTVRRTYETVQDAYMLTEEKFCHSLPMSPLVGSSDWADTNTSEIMNAAQQALKHNDIEEASHQFRRELYFSSLVDKLAGSPNEAAAQAGLDAVARHENACAIDHAVQEAWTKRVYNR
jgi:hypothetical protein